ncbi:MAG TPA: cupin domain-containing protein, partial [Burkholderiales bacterium]|nr:cupin domain-containing protein [Burkholderiales bacterium]
STLKPIRRVVTGNDESGKSRIVWDGPAPSTHEASMGAGRGHIDLWVWNESPAPLSGRTDDGNLSYDFPGPPKGGHLRVVQGLGRTANYDAKNDATIVPDHAPKEHELGRRWDRGGTNAYSGGMHKTETVDYAILLDGERTLVLDEREVEWRPGDIVIDVGAWHQWSSRNTGGGRVAFDMIAARFVDGPVGLAQGNDRVMKSDSKAKLPAGVKPARRIVVMDREPGKSCVVSDGPSPDGRTDPARPGYALQRMWVTEGTPAKIVLDTLHLPYILEPPPNGSVMNVVTFPPDASWKGKVGAAEVKSFFRSMGSPGASTYSPSAPHPYMQKTRTLEFGIVLDGEIVLVLDTQEVQLKTGDFVVQRGTNHAWSNRSSKPAVVAIASHDGA